MAKLRGSSHLGTSDLSILQSVQAGFGAQPVPYSVNVEGSSHDGNVTSARSSSVTPASVKVRNEWNCTSSPLYVFMLCKRTTIFYS